MLVVRGCALCCTKRFLGLLVGTLLLLCGAGQAWALPTTTTYLTVNSGGSVVNSVVQNALVTLTATVTRSGGYVTHGQVQFCDATAPSCLDSHLIGMAQLTSAGVATLNIRPGAGSKVYKAVFLGTTSYLTSSSSDSLSVSVKVPTTSTLVVDSAPNTVTVTVSGVGGVYAPSGTLSLFDATDGNAELGGTSLGPGMLSVGFTNAPNVTGTRSLIGDFNGDGRPDVIANSTVFLGNGDGTFQAVAQGAGTITATAVGDFNGDGKLDLASPSGVLLGNGDGTFYSPTATFPVVAGGGTTIAGDIDHDGNQDLAILTTPPGSLNTNLTILLGHGDGTFTPAARTVPAGFQSTDMVSGDFNGDGNLDFAVAGSTSGAYIILLGVSDGGFIPAPQIPGISNYDIAAGDFNGDGFTDLVLESGMYLSRGQGQFEAAIPLLGALADFERGNVAMVGDFNEDGKLDLAVPIGVLSATPGGPGTQPLVLIAFGNGDGTFSSVSGAGAGSDIEGGDYNLSVADFNGDGYPDLVAGNQYSGTALDVFLSQPTLSASATFSDFLVVGTGTHQLDTVYPADSFHEASTSNTVGLAAQMIPETLTLTVNPASSSYGQQVVLIATLSASVALHHTTNGQMVTFYSGGTGVGSGVVSAGVATLNTTSLPTGSSSLTAVYAGDTNFVAATSNAIAFTVTAVLPTINFAVANHTFGDAPFAVGATSNSTGLLSYSVVSGPATIAGATVTLTGAGTVVLQASQAAAGGYMSGSQQASFTVAAEAQSISFPGPVSPVLYGVSPLTLTASSTSGLAVTFSVVSGPGTISGSSLAVTGTGTIVVAADQAGNGNYAAAPQVAELVVVLAATPVVNFAQPSAIPYGAGLGGVLVASASSAGVSVPGAFSYKTGSTSLSASTVLAAGSYPLVATFTPTDMTRYNTASASTTLTVNKGTPVVALASGANPGQVQNSVALTATVTSPVSTPTGSVTFFDGGAMIGSSAVVNGVAALSIAFSAGSHSITAVYGGDANFVTLTSAALVESVQDFNLTSSGTTSQTVSGGSVGTYALSISPVNGSTFPAAVVLTVSGLQPGATATFTPQMIAGGSGTTNISLAVQTVKLTSRLEQDLRGKVGAIALALLLPISFGLRKSGRRLGGMICLLLLGVVAAGGLVGCGGGNSGSGATAPTSPTSPTPQTYTITVTATSGMLSHSTTLGLTVQ